MRREQRQLLLLTSSAVVVCQGLVTPSVFQPRATVSSPLHMASVVNGKADSRTSNNETVLNKEQSSSTEAAQGPGTPIFFDIDEECEGDSCQLADMDTRSSYKKKAMLQNAQLDQLIHTVPLAMPLFAYMSYEFIAQLSDAMIELLSNKNFVAVDGGAYESKIIAPAINGVVVSDV